MRFLLLLSALLAAFAGSVGVARAGVGPACQVSAVVGTNAVQACAGAVGARPAASLPSLRDVSQPPAFVDAPSFDGVPLYAGRLRT